MNSVQLLGRICNDLELKTTPGGVSVMTFNIAVDRYMGKDQEKKADFISCVAWRQTAETISRFFHKGDEIIITGSLSTRSYQNKSGTTVYVTEVTVGNFYFTHGKKNEQQPNASGAPAPAPKQQANTAPAPQAAQASPPPADDDYPF
ncbi:MAG: single-stranded DNA-binding protein [Ruminococcus sp.]|nr:single-stranded DNA-binding protein [Ruminiclostridium sp.]MBP1537408.1 single-stranded DNA-binding protein [Ruminococcus sp.]